MLNKKRILLVGAHPDDIEVMCGGTMSKYQGKTAEVKSIIFAPCLENPFNEGILENYATSMKLLGIKEAISHDYPRDLLDMNLQDIRDSLHGLKVEFNPEVIFCHSMSDFHQDHRAIASACHAIFRDSAIILSGETMKSPVHFMPNFFIVLSYENMVNKFRLLNLYNDQAWRVDVVESVAKFRGYQASTSYAEAFEVWRMIDQ